MKSGDELLRTMVSAAAIVRKDVDAEVVMVIAMGDGIVQATHVSLGVPNEVGIFRNAARYCEQNIEAIEAGLPYEHNDPRITGR